MTTPDIALWPGQLGLFPDVQVPKPEQDDIKLWSVTTVLKVLASPAIDYWARETVAKALVGIRKSLVQRVDEDGEDEVVRWGINATYRRPKGERSAAELGTAFHDVAEEIAITGRHGPVDDELAPLVAQFEDWLARAQPTFTAAEMPVYDLTYGVAGTMDGGMILQGEHVCHDYKSSKRSFDRQGKPTHPYPEAALQLSKYRYSEWAVPVSPRRWEQQKRRYYLFGDPERDAAVPMPKYDGAIVIHCAPEHCDAYVVRADEEIHNYFLYCLEASRFVNDISKTVIGNKLIFEKVA